MTESTISHSGALLYILSALFQLALIGEERFIYFIPDIVIIIAECIVRELFLSEI